LSEESTDGSSPLDAVFEKAVRPYLTTDALRKDFAADTPVIVMGKGDDLPTETRKLQGGGTLTVPVLAALKDSKFASKSTVGAFDFSSMDADAVALMLPKGGTGTSDIRVVTKAGSGALLVADLDGMLEGVVALADNPAMSAFPGGSFLMDALRTGISQAKEELRGALTTPDATGKSLLDQLHDAAPEAQPSQAKGSRSAKAPKVAGTGGKHR
jgi:hypothetical protein